MRKIAVAVALFLGFLCATSAQAQYAWTARVIASCGTPPFTLNLDAPVTVFMDQTGLVCMRGNSGAGPTTPTYTVPGTAAYTDTIKALAPATDATLLAATAGLKSVCVMNIGLNPATITNGASAAAVGNGQALSPAPVAGSQGGGYCWPLPPTNAIHAISTAGTTVIVTVGQ